MNEEMQAKKEMTINELAALMQAGFEKSANQFNDLDKRMTAGFESSEKKMDEKIDDLARTIQNSLLESEDRLNKKITETEDRISTEMSESTNNLKAELNKKVSKIEYNTLTYRVEKLEKKLA